MRMITHRQYLELLGLLVLAERHNQAIMDIKRATAALLGETDADGHVADAVYGDTAAEVLLRRLDITVASREGESSHDCEQR